MTRNAPAAAGPWLETVEPSVSVRPAKAVGGALSAVTTRSGRKGATVTSAGAVKPLFVSLSSLTALPVSATAERWYEPGDDGAVMVVLAVDVAEPASDVMSRNPTAVPAPGAASVADM